MDKYEYQVCADQIKALIKEHRFQEAMDIADSIDWRRVKSFSMLCTVSEIYKATKHYSESRDILLLAYERYPDRANVVYALGELAVKLDDISDAIEYYKEYVRLKPHDTNRYVLLYKIYDAQDVPLEDKISLLEEFKKAEYTERWAYELALLYHKDGQETKCIETCDELALWFGEGPFVRKALELKMQHAPLTKEQQRKYDGVEEAPRVLTGETEETVHIYETQPLNPYSQGENPYETVAFEGASQQQYQQQSYPQKDYAAPVYSAPAGNEPAYSESAYSAPAYSESVSNAPAYSASVSSSPVNPASATAGFTQDIKIAPYSDDKFSTINLQEELARNMQEFYARENGDAEKSPYVGTTSELYEKSEEQFMNQLNQAGPMQPENEQMSSQEIAEQPEDRSYYSSESAQYNIEQPAVHEEELPINEIHEEVPVIEEQIPGQMNLGDFINDVQENKSSVEEPRMQQAKARTKRQTQDIMSQLAGVIPGGGDSVDDIQKKLYGQEETTEEANIEEVLKDDKSGTVTRTTLSTPSFGRENQIKRTESGTKINGPKKSSITGEIPDFLPSSGKKPEVEIKPEIKPEIRPEIKPEIRPEIKSEIKPEIRPEVKPDVRPALQAAVPPVQSNEPVGRSNPVVRQPQPDYGEIEEIEEKEEESEAVNEPVKIKHGLTAPIIYPYEVDDLGEVEELETIDQPDEIEDMLKTRPIPIEEIEARQRYEAGLEDEYSGSERETKSQPVRSYMTFDEKITSRRDFDDSEMAIFGRFEGIEALKAQIVDVMDDMSMEAHHGNVVVTGAECYGRKGMAIDIVKAIQVLDSSFSGKVAKISGEALNKKNIPMTLSKLRNGALIVENAGGLTPITINSITDSLMADEGSILVVLEGDRETIDPLLKGCAETKMVFDARIDIPDFTNDDLVAYARCYAREQEYSIDEMGILAIYNRIGDLQTIDHVVSLEEVEDIIEGAIRHVDRKNMSHFMDVLLSKRYDEDDYIVLREKDFLN